MLGNMMKFLPFHHSLQLVQFLLAIAGPPKNPVWSDLTHWSLNIILPRLSDAGRRGKRLSLIGGNNPLHTTNLISKYFTLFENQLVHLLLSQNY